MPRPPSTPAGRAVVAAGISYARLAVACNVSTATVSRWLAGVYPPPSDFYDVITVVGGPGLADEVRALVDEAQAVSA